MGGCSICGEPFEGPTVVCSVCARKIRKKCAKKFSGEYYCSSCLKEAKSQIRYEKMVERDMDFGR